MITINGNSIDPRDPRFPPDASGTDWILLQCNREPTVEDYNALKVLEVKIDRRIEQLGFLCRYRPADLAALQALPFVDHAVTYHPDFVVHNVLGEAFGEGGSPSEDFHVRETAAGPACAVTITLHKDTPESGHDVLRAIQSITSHAEALGADDQSLRVWLPVEHLADVASIDCVRTIEHTPGLPTAAAAKACSSAVIDVPRVWWMEEGFGNMSLDYGALAADEVIANIDTGFDNGLIDDANVHPFFKGHFSQSRVVKLSRQPFTDPDPKDYRDLDSDSHGTHTAGCILGYFEADAASAQQYPYISLVRGPAADARLHCIMFESRPPGAPPGPWVDTNDYRGQLLEPYAAPANGIAQTAYIRSIQFRKPWTASITWNNNKYISQGPYSDLHSNVRDLVVCEDPLKLVALAAGNEGDKLGYTPIAGGVAPKPGHQINGTEWSKNTLSVGATWNYRHFDAATGLPTDGLGANPTGNLADIRDIADFSNKGPTDSEGANPIFLKPDVVAPGKNVLSARSRAVAVTNVQRLVEYNDGTSFATPLVSGCAAVLRSRYRAKNNGQLPPTSALLRAMIINGAVSCEGGNYWMKESAEVAPRQLGYPPDAVQGYGRVNLRRSLMHIGRVNKSGCYQGELPSGQMWPILPEDIAKFEIPCTQGQKVSVTLCWIDTEGAALTNGLKLELVEVADATVRFDPDPVGGYNWYDPTTVNTGTVKRITRGIRPGEAGVPGPLRMEISHIAGPDQVHFGVCWLIEP